MPVPGHATYKILLRKEQIEIIIVINGDRRAWMYRVNDPITDTLKIDDSIIVYYVVFFRQKYMIF